MQVAFREAVKADIAFIELCIHLLAQEEEFPGKVQVTQEDLEEALFSENPAVKVLICASGPNLRCICNALFHLLKYNGQKGPSSR